MRLVQLGVALRMPHSRPMPGIGPRCHELRIVDVGVTWRILYRIDPEEILVVDIFSKKSRGTPHLIIEASQRRLRRYDDAP